MDYDTLARTGIYVGFEDFRGRVLKTFDWSFNRRLGAVAIVGSDSEWSPGRWDTLEGAQLLAPFRNVFPLRDGIGWFWQHSVVITPGKRRCLGERGKGRGDHIRDGLVGVAPRYGLSFAPEHLSRGIFWDYGSLFR